MLSLPRDSMMLCVEHLFKILMAFRLKNYRRTYPIFNASLNRQSSPYLIKDGAILDLRAPEIASKLRCSTGLPKYLLKKPRNSVPCRLDSVYDSNIFDTCRKFLS